MLQCEIIGNLGNDAEIKEFNGKRYVSFNVAHTDKRKDANGTTIEHTTWASVLWSGDGGGLTPYLKRGCKVFVRGALSVKVFTGKDLQTRAAVNIQAREVCLCGSVKDQPSTPTAAPPSAPASSSPTTTVDGLPF